MLTDRIDPFEQITKTSSLHTKQNETKIKREEQKNAQ